MLLYGHCENRRSGSDGQFSGGHLCGGSMRSIWRGRPRNNLGNGFWWRFQDSLCCGVEGFQNQNRWFCWLFGLVAAWGGPGSGARLGPGRHCRGFCSAWGAGTSSRDPCHCCLAGASTFFSILRGHGVKTGRVLGGHGVEVSGVVTVKVTRIRNSS